MKIKLIQIGKTDDKCVEALVQKYEKRLKSYINFEILTIPDIKNNKNLSEAQQKQKEGDLIRDKISTSDYLVLLDENGKEFTSEKFAVFLQKQMNSGIKNLIFIIGGPYGFSEAVYQRANSKLSLSQMTFSHQLVRSIFLEQLYRGYSIIHNHPYHHK